MRAADRLPTGGQADPNNVGRRYTRPLASSRQFKPGVRPSESHRRLSSPASCFSLVSDAVCDVTYAVFVFTELSVLTRTKLVQWTLRFVLSITCVIFISLLSFFLCLLYNLFLLLLFCF